MKRIDLSILIISYNTLELTLNCLHTVEKSLEKSDVRYEVIVVDNASSDGSAAKLKSYAADHENVVFIANKDNIGFGRANNQAAEAAQGEYILLLNSDTEVIDNAIEKLYKFVSGAGSKAEIAGAKLLNKDGTDQPSCGPFYTLPVVFAALFLKGDYWGLTRQSPKAVMKTDWVSGACIMMKRSDFQTLDGFDKDIFMYMEEIDLLLRASRKGLKTYFFPDARFVHFGSASSGGRTFPILQVYKGFLYLYKKHYSRTSLFILKCMLQLKAYISILVGKTLRKRYLIDTYEKALELARMG